MTEIEPSFSLVYGGTDASYPYSTPPLPDSLLKSIFCFTRRQNERFASESRAKWRMPMEYTILFIIYLNLRDLP